MQPRLEGRDPAPTRQRWRDGDDVNREAISGVYDIGDGWACRLTLERLNEVWGVSGIEVAFAVDLLGPKHGRPDRPLTSAQLHRLRIGAMADELRAHLRKHEDFRRLAPDVRAELRRRRSQGGNPDAEYALVAALYVDAANDPAVRSPNEHVATQLGEGWDAARVRDYVYRARHQRGLLSPTRRGQAGGELTDKAQALLTTNGGD